MEFKPEKTLGHKLRLVHNTIDKYFDRLCTEDTKKVPRGQVMIIHYLMDHPEDKVYQKDIERVFTISGATATNMIKGLEKNGLVERIPDKKDARLKRLVLTEKAIVREERIRKIIMALEGGMVKGFTQEEITIYSSMTERIIQNLEEMTENISLQNNTK